MTKSFSKTLYQKLIEHMNEAVWMGDKNECTIYANPKFCEIMEYSLKEIIGKESYDFWDKESAETVRKINANDRKNGVSSSYTGTLISKSGKRIPVLLNGTPLPDGGTIGIMTDLTKLEEKDSIYKTLIENMNEAVWMGDKNEHTQYANPKFCEIMGYTLNEILGKESYDFWDENSGKIVQNVNARDRKNGVGSSYQGVLISKTGKRIPVLLNGTPLPDGGTIGIMTDLTELEKKESIFKMLIEHMSEAVYLTDNKARIVYANPGFCTMMEYSLDEVFEKSEYTFWDKESVQKIHDVNSRERKKGQSSHYEGVLVTKHGQEIPVFVSGSPLPDGGTIGICTDLREIQKKEEEKKILSNALQFTTDAIVLFNHSGIVKLWNSGAEMMFGYKKIEIEGKSLQKIFPGKDLSDIFHGQKVLHNFELTGKHKNNTEIFVSATLTSLSHETCDKEGDKCSYLLIARDITNQHKFEEELTIKYQKLKDSYNQFGIIRRQMDYVFELLDVAENASSLKGIADFIVSAIIMLTRVDACVLRKYNPKKDTMDLLACAGVTDAWEGTYSFPLKNTLAEKAFESGIPLKIIDVSKEPKYRTPSLARKHNLCSLLLIPLKYHSQRVGALWLYATPDKKLEIFENEFIEKYAQLVEMILGIIDQKGQN
ncbi:PAS domain S-box protein [Candidatus Peregrinibacteria bacterium]|nr:PAS domain S-box protein [Candidatus Peregrinibacteria bacterium]